MKNLNKLPNENAVKYTTGILFAECIYNWMKIIEYFRQTCKKNVPIPMRKNTDKKQEAASGLNSIKCAAYLLRYTYI